MAETGPAFGQDFPPEGAVKISAKGSGLEPAAGQTRKAGRYGPLFSSLFFKDLSFYVAFLFDAKQTAQQTTEQFRTLDDDDFHSKPSITIF